MVDVPLILKVVFSRRKRLKRKSFMPQNIAYIMSCSVFKIIFVTHLYGFELIFLKAAIHSGALTMGFKFI